MKWTTEQRVAIRNHWGHSYGALRFIEDGHVLARRSPRDAWGILYTPEQSRSHLRAVGLLETAAR